MPIRPPEKRREYEREWYLRNRKKAQASVRRYRKRLKQGLVRGHEVSDAELDHRALEMLKKEGLR